MHGSTQKCQVRHKNARFDTKMPFSACISLQSHYYTPTHTHPHPPHTPHPHPPPPHPATPTPPPPLFFTGTRPGSHKALNKNFVIRVSCLFVSLLSHFCLFHFFPPIPVLPTISRPLSSPMCSITPETANVGSSYNRMWGPGISCWLSDCSNCSHWSLTLTFTLTS